MAFPLWTRYLFCRGSPGGVLRFVKFWLSTKSVRIAKGLTSFYLHTYKTTHQLTCPSTLTNNQPKYTMSDKNNKNTTHCPVEDPEWDHYW